MMEETTNEFGHGYLPPVFVGVGSALGESALRLYVVEILDVGVKVGVTKKAPADRLNQHVQMAWSFRRHIGRAWVSTPDRWSDVLDVEAALVARFGGATASRSEYLDAAFDAVVRDARKRFGATGVFPAKVAREWSGRLVKRGVSP
jgi:hypothetical protein